MAVDKKSRGDLLRFVVLYALMYGAFGVSSPFLPAFFERRGLTAEQLAERGLSPAAALLELNALFTAWVETVYDPEALESAFRPGFWSNLLVDRIMRRE